MLRAETCPIPAPAPAHRAAPGPLHGLAPTCLRLPHRKAPLGGLYVYQTSERSKALIERPSGEPLWCRFSYLGLLQLHMNDLFLMAAGMLMPCQAAIATSLGWATRTTLQMPRWMRS